MEGSASTLNPASSPLPLSSGFQVEDDKREGLSAEDVDWIDSCLIKESETFDSNWVSMKEALLVALNSETESRDSLKSLDNETPKEGDVEMVTLGEYVETTQPLPSEDNSDKILRTPFNNEQAESSSGNGDVNDRQSSLTFYGNPFLPSYIEGSEEAEIDASGNKSHSSKDEIESPNDGIFRVWDLNVPAEENELGVLLKNVLEDDDEDLRSKPLPDFADLGVREDLGEVSLDDVIDAVSKISLSSSSDSSSK